MNYKDLLGLVAIGEDSSCQFKTNVHNVNSLASEMAAFANSEGGIIFIGVADDGSIPGLSREDVNRINQIISNAASQLVRSPLAVHTENVAMEDGSIVIVLTIQKGIDKPYFDKNGVIWLKVGADKRRVNSKEAMSFIQRNLHKVQAGRGVNAPGIPEIPLLVFEELLVNALVHRDYLISAPIRLFVFDNRIEIVSPGHLPNNLTVEKIRVGNSNIRNPILVSHVAKGLLPYRGLGSGIKRALEAWPKIDFTDDREGCLFTATVDRPEIKSSVKTEEEVLTILSKRPETTISELAETFGLTTRAVEKQIARLREDGLLRRVGPKKGGHWEVLGRKG